MEPGRVALTRALGHLRRAQCGWETRFFLEQRWSHRLSVHSEDFTDQEAVAAILRITRGNIRLIERLMMQVEHILVANPAVSVVTRELVETARANLVIGMN
jgi:hypothetical protein